MYFQICLISYCFKIYLFWYLAIPGPVYFVWCWNGVCFSEHRIEFEKCPNLRDILVSQMKMKIMFISLLKLSDSVWNLVFQLLDLKEWHLHRIQNRQTCFTLFFFFILMVGLDQVCGEIQQVMGPLATCLLISECGTLVIW